MAFTILARLHGYGYSPWERTIFVGGWDKGEGGRDEEEEEEEEEREGGREKEREI